MATVQEFAQLVEEAHHSYIRAHYPGLDLKDCITLENGKRREVYGVTVTPGRKYTRVDVGMSGRFMVENDTGAIYGIKAYGVIHRGHYYGTLDAPKAAAFGGR